jgi:glutathione S-transferase
MCSWPWINQMHVIHLDRADLPNVQRWFDAVAARPASSKAAASNCRR